MAITVMQKGNIAHCVGTFRNLAGKLTDPQEAWFEYSAGGLVWSTPVTPTRVSEGIFEYDLSVAHPNHLLRSEYWYVRFYSPPGDEVQAAQQETFLLLNPNLI